MSRTEHHTLPHAQDVSGERDATRQHPDRSSEDIEQRNAPAAFVTVALAVQARALQRARLVVQAAPEIRLARVEAARRALQEGTLTLDGPALAEKLLQAARIERCHA